jgi:hypothetical protein
LEVIDVLNLLLPKQPAIVLRSPVGHEPGFEPATTEAICYQE